MSEYSCSWDTCCDRVIMDSLVIIVINKYLIFLLLNTIFQLVHIIQSFYINYQMIRYLQTINRMSKKFNINIVIFSQPNLIQLIQLIMDLKQRKNLCNLTIVLSQKSIIKKQIDSSNLSDQRQDQTQYTQRVQQIDVFEQQKYLEEQQLSQKSNILESDKNILYQIMLLIFLGITYEIIFELCVQLLQLMKPFIQHISSTLQFLSLFNVFILFKCFHQQQIKILNKKNDLDLNYSFIIPKEYKQDDDILIKLESRINLITLY